MLTEEKEDQAIRVERDIAVPPGEVYRAFTNESALVGWLSNAADVDPRTGGRIYLWWDRGYHTSGVYTGLERGKTVAFSWRGPNDPEATEVRVSITAQGKGGTRITVTHTGLGPGEEWAEAAFQDKKGWDSALENLQSVLETGVDLRMARRPMFGINGGNELNDERIARLGLPVTEGLWLAGLFEGMGAQRAGLQKDDVVVSLGGQPVTSFAGIGATLQSYRAGDKVEVEFYRGAQRHSVTVELSKRPDPNLPATHEELVESLRATCATLDAELDGVLEGVTEAEADFRPEPDGWNVKEILAHLITSEQGTQSLIYLAIEDGDTNAPFFSNEPHRIRAVASSYGTLASAVEQLKHSQAITQAQVASIPPETRARKQQYRAIATLVTTFQDHNREHMGEIAALVKAARGKV